MAANMSLELVSEQQGWRQGFANMARKEFSLWWSTHRWWKAAILWTLIPNLMVALVSYVSIVEEGKTGLAALEVPMQIFFVIAGLATAIGVIIAAQDAILGERQSGTAEWILSKPVSRSAFVLAKLVAHAASFGLLAVLLPCLVGYLQLALWGGLLLPVLPFLGMTLLVLLHAFFYLTFAIMLGTTAQARGPIIGSSLGMLFGGQMIAGGVKLLRQVTPWKMVEMAAIAYGQGESLALAATPAAMTLIWTILFAVLAVRRFQRIEI